MLDGSPFSNTCYLCALFDEPREMYKLHNARKICINIPNIHLQIDPVNPKTVLVTVLISYCMEQSLNTYINLIL